MDGYIYLSRHGQTDWNVEGRIQGQTDTNLTEVGRTQAIELRNYFKEIPLDTVVTSDLVRAQETGKVVAESKGLSIQISELLRERHYGNLEGRLISDFEAFFRSPDTIDWDISKENIEEEHQAAIRFQKAIENIDVQKRHVLIISHAAVLLAFLKSQFFEECNSLQIHDIPNGGIWKIARTGNTLQLLTKRHVLSSDH